MHRHTPVLLEEAISGLAIKPGGIYMDATFGRGGHSQAILAQLNEHGRLLAVDKDPQAIAYAKQLLAAENRFSILQASFANVATWLKQQDLLGRLDGILLDLGVSSPQIDTPERGFSFLNDGPLDMRMDPSSGVSVAECLQAISQQELTRILKVYGEERFAKRIARAIIDYRQQEVISTTRQLAEIIAQAIPKRELNKHPATRSFQALRIYINNELEDLRIFLNHCLHCLAIGGRLVVISFHSLEDRIVKRYMREHARGDADIPKNLPITVDKIKPPLKIIGRAIKASAKEIDENIRARSAVLRIAEKINPLS